jgi:hypothetical protein
MSPEHPLRSRRVNLPTGRGIIGKDELMSRRAVAQPRKSSSQSGLTGECQQTHASPVEFGEVKYPKIRNIPRMKNWNSSYQQADLTVFGRNHSAAPEACDIGSQGYRKISEIKNRIRASASQAIAGQNRLTGLKPCGKARSNKSIQIENESDTITMDNGFQINFINAAVKPPARISDFPESAYCTAETDSPIFGKSKYPMNTTALLPEAATEKDTGGTEIETVSDKSTKAVDVEKQEPPIQIRSSEEISPETFKPLKRKLKLIRAPEIKEDENEEKYKTENAEPAAVAKEDEFVRKSEETNAAAGSDDKMHKQDINAGLKIEFAYPDNEAAETDTESENSVAVMEKTPRRTEPIRMETDGIKPVLAEENNEGVRPQVRLELKRAAEGPRPEMKRPDLRRAQRSDSRPWSMDVEIALRDLMGDVANSSKVSFEQMAAAWKRGYDTYFSTSLAETRFPYIWVDVHTVGGFEKDCEKRLVSFMGVNLRGQLRLLALVKEDTENPEFWRDILRDLEKRDLANPRLFIGDSRLPLWQCLGSVFPRAEIQYCRTALTEQILEHLPKDQIKEARTLLEQIYQAKNRQTALSLVEKFKSKYTAEFPHAASELIKNTDNLFTFFRFPRQHWYAIGQSHRISGAYPSRALLATVFKCRKFLDLSVYLVFNYLLRTQRGWSRIACARFLRRIQAGKKYSDGRRTRGHQPLSAIIPRKTRKRTGLRGWFSESARLILSIFYNRPSSGKKAVFKDAGHKSELSRMDAVRKTLNPDNNPSPLQAAAGLTSSPKNDAENGARGDVQKISRPVIRPTADKLVNAESAIDQYPSRQMSGLERELLEDLKLEKVAN